MKTLKFSHEEAQQIRQTRKIATWRIYDDKDLQVNDQVMVIDKVDPAKPQTWQQVGVVQVSEVIEKRIKDIANDDFLKGEQILSPAEMLIKFQRIVGKQVIDTTPVKHITLELQTQQSSQGVIDDKRTTVVHEAKLYADGGSRGNPGPSASGYVLTTIDNAVVVNNGEYIGITTNNQAEYQALKLGLEEALKRTVSTLHVYMDSMLVVNQMLGVFKVKNRDLWPIHDATRQLAQKFAHITFTHVPRELNKAADHMVNQVLDAHGREQDHS